MNQAKSLFDKMMSSTDPLTEEEQAQLLDLYDLSLCQSSEEEKYPVFDSECPYDDCKGIPYPENPFEGMRWTILDDGGTTLCPGCDRWYHPEYRGVPAHPVEEDEPGPLDCDLSAKSAKSAKSAHRMKTINISSK